MPPPFNITPYIPDVFDWDLAAALVLVFAGYLVDQVAAIAPRWVDAEMFVLWLFPWLWAFA